MPMVSLDWQRAIAGWLRTVRERQDGAPVGLAPLPSPLADCERVMYRVEELSSSIREAQRLRTHAEDQARELMAATERTLWPSESLKNAPTLESVTTFLARGRQSQQGQSNHFLIKTQHVQQDRYVPTILRLDSAVATKVNPESTAQDGDALIACSAAGCLGRVAQYRYDGRVASTDTHVAIARANPKAIDPDYLYAYLSGAQGQYQLRSRERGDWKREKISFRLTELNLNDLKKVPVPLPPISDQRRIVDELNELETEVKALRQLQRETSAEIDALLPSVLSRAFAGEL
jgi:type I restriction enzyme S subunit